MADETEKDGRVARLGRWAGPIAGAVIWAVPGGTLEPEAQRLAALTTWMAIWWMTEALPVAATALLPLALFPWLGIQRAAEVAPNYGHDLIWLFFGGFQLAFAVERWGLHRRMALFLVTRLGTRGDRLVLGFMVAVALMSMWLLNTSTTLMMLPVAMAVAVAIEGPEAGPFGKALMLGMAYAASVGGMGTYVGTAPNGVFAGVARKMGVDIPFADWMLFAAPLSLLLVGLIWLYLTRFAFAVPRADLPPDHPARVALDDDLGPWTSGQKRVAIVFGLAVALWIGRRWILEVFGYGPKEVTDATVAIVCAVALFVVPSGQGEPLLTWRESGRTPWHILLLFGGGFALAGGFEQTGLSRWLGEQLATVATHLPLPLTVLAVVLFVTFLTEVTSNTATATVLLPVMGGLAVALELHPALLMLPATLAASCAFMLPVATPPNAIVYGSGWVSMGDMARAGVGLNVLTGVVISAWVLTWGRWTLGL